MVVEENKEKNLLTAAKMIEKGVKQNARIIVLPEIFNSPYQADLLPLYAEEYPGPTTTMLSIMAKKHKICIIGGSIPEKDGDKIYNTCFVFNDQGLLINKYRKIHLYDMNIPGKVTFKESETLSSGNEIPLMEWKELKFGVIICYDVRFPELARILSEKGANIIFIPAAFNITTGSDHWELLMRSRALDNQVFVVAASPARNTSASYLAWGHSMIVNPWGTIIAEADEKQNLLITEIDLSEIETVRQKISLSTHRKKDLYSMLMK